MKDPSKSPETVAEIPFQGPKSTPHAPENGSNPGFPLLIHGVRPALPPDDI